MRTSISGERTDSRWSATRPGCCGRRSLRRKRYFLHDSDHYSEKVESNHWSRAMISRLRRLLGLSFRDRACAPLLELLMPNRPPGRQAEIELLGGVAEIEESMYMLEPFPGRFVPAKRRREIGEELRSSQDEHG